MPIGLTFTPTSPTASAVGAMAMSAGVMDTPSGLRAHACTECQRLWCVQFTKAGHRDGGVMDKARTARPWPMISVTLVHCGGQARRWPLEGLLQAEHLRLLP